MCCTCAHPRGRDRGVEQDRAARAKEARPCGAGLRLRRLGCDQFLLGVAEDAAAQRVAHLDDVVGELFAAHAESTRCR